MILGLGKMLLIILFKEVCIMNEIVHVKGCSTYY